LELSRKKRIGGSIGNHCQMVGEVKGLPLGGHKKGSGLPASSGGGGGGGCGDSVQTSKTFRGEKPRIDSRAKKKEEFKNPPHARNAEKTAETGTQGIRLGGRVGRGESSTRRGKMSRKKTFERKRQKRVKTVTCF